MKTIKLSCRTRGLTPGATIDVGNKKAEITLLEATELVKMGFASEVKESFDGTKANLSKEVEVLKSQLEESAKEVEVLKTQLEEAAKEIEALKAQPEESDKKETSKK